jgi:hypothetical protein
MTSRSEIRALRKVAAIDRQRDEVINAGFTFAGAQFHADALFQSQVQAFMLAWASGILPPAATVSIRRKDDVTVQMNQAQVGTLAAALMQFVQTVYAQSWVAKDTLP